MRGGAAGPPAFSASMDLVIWVTVAMVLLAFLLPLARISVDGYCDPTSSPSPGCPASDPALSSEWGSLAAEAVLLTGLIALSVRASRAARVTAELWAGSIAEGMAMSMTILGANVSMIQGSTGVTVPGGLAIIIAESAALVLARMDLRSLQAPARRRVTGACSLSVLQASLVLSGAVAISLPSFPLQIPLLLLCSLGACAFLFILPWYTRASERRGVHPLFLATFPRSP